MGSAGPLVDPQIGLIDIEVLNFTGSQQSLES